LAENLPRCLQPAMALLDRALCVGRNRAKDEDDDVGDATEGDATAALVVGFVGLAADPRFRRLLVRAFAAATATSPVTWIATTAAQRAELITCVDITPNDGAKAAAEDASDSTAVRESANDGDSAARNAATAVALLPVLVAAFKALATLSPADPATLAHVAGPRRFDDACPLLPLLLLHPNATVRAWARQELSRLDVSVAADDEMVTMFLVTATFIVGELLPGGGPIVTAALCCPPAALGLPTAGSADSGASNITPELFTAAKDTTEALLAVVSNYVPLSEVLEACLSLLDLCARTATLCTWYTGLNHNSPTALAGRPDKRPAPPVLRTAVAACVAAVATVSAQLSAFNKVVGVDCLGIAGTRVKDALLALALMPPLPGWARPPLTDRAAAIGLSELVCDVCAGAVARVSCTLGEPFNTQTDLPDAGQRLPLELVRVHALANVRELLEPATTVVVHSLHRLAAQTSSIFDFVPRAVALAGQRVNAAEVPLLVAVERLVGRVRDPKVCSTQLSQLAAIAAWLHAQVGLLWSALTLRNAAVTAGTGEASLVDLERLPSVGDRGIGPNDTFVAVAAAAKDTMAVGIRVATLSALHAWLHECREKLAGMLNSVMGMKDPSSTASSVAAASTRTPTAPVTVTRSLAAAALFGALLVDLLAAAPSELALAPSLTSSAAFGGRSAVPAAFALADYWKLTAPEHRRHFRRRMVAALFLDPWSAVSLAVEGAIQRLTTAAVECFRGIPVPTGDEADVTSVDVADGAAIALVRSFAFGVAVAAAPQAGVADCVRSARRRESGLFTVRLHARRRRCVAEQRAAGSICVVGGAAGRTPAFAAAAWALRRDALHAFPQAASAGGRRRELLMGSAVTAPWAAAVSALAADPQVLRNAGAEAQLVYSAGGEEARHACALAWGLAVAAIDWVPSSTPRSDFFAAVARLPTCHSAVIPAMCRRPDAVLRTGAVVDMLVAAASTYVSAPPEIVAKTLTLLRLLSPSELQIVKAAAGESRGGGGDGGGGGVRCAWLLALAGGEGVLEAQLAGTRAADVMERRFAQFERQEADWKAEQKRQRDQKKAESRRPTVVEMLAGAPAMKERDIAARKGTSPPTVSVAAAPTAASAALKVPSNYAHIAALERGAPNIAAPPRVAANTSAVMQRDAAFARERHAEAVATATAEATAKLLRCLLATPLMPRSEANHHQHHHAGGKHRSNAQRQSEDEHPVPGYHDDLSDGDAEMVTAAKSANAPHPAASLSRAAESGTCATCRPTTASSYRRMPHKRVAAARSWRASGPISFRRISWRRTTRCTHRAAPTARRSPRRTTTRRCSTASCRTSLLRHAASTPTTTSGCLRTAWRGGGHVIALRREGRRTRFWGRRPCRSRRSDRRPSRPSSSSSSRTAEPPRMSTRVHPTSWQRTMSSCWNSRCRAAWTIRSSRTFCVTTRAGLTECPRRRRRTSLAGAVLRGTTAPRMAPDAASSRIIRNPLTVPARRWRGVWLSSASWTFACRTRAINAAFTSASRATVPA
jgi:hypothetical protein